MIIILKIKQQKLITASCILMFSFKKICKKPISLRKTSTEVILIIALINGEATYYSNDLVFQAAGKAVISCGLIPAAKDDQTFQIRGRAVPKFPICLCMAVNKYSDH